MSKTQINGDPLCPCGTGRRFSDCCEKFHRGVRAPDAESLMRSRYAAFVRRNAEYLLRTWDSSTRPAVITFDSQQKWLGLEILESRNSHGAAEVEFIARFRIAGASAQRHHERSRFLLQDDEWFYVDGVMRGD